MARFYHTNMAGILKRFALQIYLIKLSVNMPFEAFS